MTVGEFVKMCTGILWINIYSPINGIIFSGCAKELDFDISKMEMHAFLPPRHGYISLMVD